MVKVGLDVHVHQFAVGLLSHVFVESQGFWWSGSDVVEIYLLPFVEDTVTVFSSDSLPVQQNQPRS